MDSVVYFHVQCIVLDVFSVSEVVPSNFHVLSV